MRRIIFFVIIVFEFFEGFSQKAISYTLPNKAGYKNILIENQNEYKISQTLLVSTDGSKQCLLINILPKKVQGSDISNHILITIKAFMGNSLEKSLELVSIDTIKTVIHLNELANQATRIFSSHLPLDVTTLVQKGGQESTLENYTVFIERDKKYYKIKGDVLCQFFNLTRM